MKQTDNKREKIISLAEKCGMAVSAGGNGYWDSADQMQAFYHAAQREAFESAAKLCEQVITHPAGHGGQWEGYGPVKTQRDGKRCAAEIREMVDADKVTK